MAYIPLKPKKAYKTWQTPGDNLMYHTKRWKQTRAAFLKRRPLCEECKRLGITTPATVVDHIRQIKLGGHEFDFNNLQALCKTHHAKKSGREGAKKINLIQNGRN